MSALMIARITVKDPAKFQDYMSRTKQTAARFGAEMVHRGKVGRTLNGPGDHEMVVVARFPDLAQIDAWYSSDAYQPLKALRDEGAVMHMTAYEVIG